MTNLFKKAAVFTDIHFGLKSNSTLHNEDCLNFVKWATQKAKEEGAKCVIGQYIPTKKNKPCENFLSDFGFKKDDESWRKARRRRTKKDGRKKTGDDDNRRLTRDPRLDQRPKQTCRSSH